MEKFDVFISYSRKDYIDDNNNVIPDNPVSIIKSRLSEEGISYWFDEEGIYSGQNFVEKIVTNIEASKLFLFLSTANANESKWTCKEIASADEFGKPIIPVRIDKSPYNKKVMFRISDLDYIEYYSNPESALNDLVISIKAHLQSIQEEEKRKKEEEAKKREAELKRKEEEKARKEQEEKRRQEEQLQIVADIELACTKLNNEEKKIELDRSTLLVSTEKVANEQRRAELKSFITDSSPIRQKQQEDLKQLQAKLTNLEAQLKNLSDEKERLTAQLAQAVNSNTDQKDIDYRTRIANLTKALSHAEEQAKVSEQECLWLKREIKDLKDQLEKVHPKSQTGKSNKTAHIVYLSTIIALIVGGAIWLSSLYHDKNRWEMLSDSHFSQLYDANEAIEKLADGNPFVVTDICVYNKGDYCGDSIYSSKSTYLIPKIVTYGIEWGETYNLFIKIFYPSGVLATGPNSPSGYSYSQEHFISKGQDSCYFNGWGGNDPGQWPSGSYRIEVWYNGKMMKSKEFKVY